MILDVQLKERWEKLLEKLSCQFNDNQPIDIEAIIYLIGLQEMGNIHKDFKKDEKVNLMHVAVCTLLEPYGYYEYEYTDSDGWPHFQLKEALPRLKPGEQSILMKEAIILYFLENNYID